VDKAILAPPNDTIDYRAVGAEDGVGQGFPFQRFGQGKLPIGIIGVGQNKPFGEGVDLIGNDWTA
jgi:hypothetical protein